MDISHTVVEIDRRDRVHVEDGKWSARDAAGHVHGGVAHPLYRFALENIVARYDLDRADGRVDALREAARLVSSVRDRSKVDAFARAVAVLADEVASTHPDCEPLVAATRDPKARVRCDAEIIGDPAARARRQRRPSPQ